MKFLIFVSLIAFNGNSVASDERSFLFNVGEAILNLDGKSYESVISENERLSKEVDKLKSENRENVTKTNNLRKDQDSKNSHMSYYEKTRIFKIFDKESHGIVRVDFCESDLGERYSLDKSNKLYLVSASGFGEMDYLKKVSIDIESGEESTSKTLFVFEVNRTLLEERMFAVNSKPSIYLPFEEADLKPQKIKIDRKECTTSKIEELEYVHCSDQEYLKLDGKKILHFEDSDSGSNIKVLGRAVINSREYIHVTYDTRTGTGLILLSKDGDHIYPQSCSVSIDC